MPNPPDGPQSPVAMLQAAALAAHNEIHDNHDPVRVQKVMDAILAVEGLTHADLYVLSAMLMANGMIVTAEAQRPHVALGINSMTQMLMNQHAAGTAIIAGPNLAAMPTVGQG